MILGTRREWFNIKWDAEGAGGAAVADPPADPVEEPTPVDPEATSILNPTDPTPADPDPAEPTTSEERPEWLPEKHWDEKTKTPRVESLAKAALDAQKELRRLQTGKGEGVPDKAEGYLSGEAFNDDGFVFPEDSGADPLPSDHPALVALAEVSLEEGIPRDKFNRIVAKVGPGLLSPENIAYSVEDELVKLGRGDLKDGQHRGEAASGWVGALLSRNAITQEQHDLMINTWGKTAAGVELILWMRNQTGEKPIPMGAPIASEGAKTPEQLASMMNDPRYQTDEGYRQEVMAEWDKAVPKDPKSEGPVFT